MNVLFVIRPLMKPIPPCFVTAHNTTELSSVFLTASITLLSSSLASRTKSSFFILSEPEKQILSSSVELITNKGKTVLPKPKISWFNYFPERWQPPDPWPYTCTNKTETEFLLTKSCNKTDYCIRRTVSWKIQGDKESKQEREISSRNILPI